MILQGNSTEELQWGLEVGFREQWTVRQLLSNPSLSHLLDCGMNLCAKE